MKNKGTFLSRNLRRVLKKKKHSKKAQQPVRKPMFESMEPRLLLSADFSMQHVADTFVDNKIDVTGVTVITHGFQLNGDGDSLMPIANAIHNFTDDDNDATKQSWLLDYDVPSEGDLGVFDATQSHLPDAGDLNKKGEVIVLFDWGVESNERTSGWTEAAGDALFNMLVGLDLVDPMKGENNDIPLHFIAHSFGSAVTSEAIERLDVYDVKVEQATFLDPHDFDQNILGYDSAQEQWTLNQPDNYGVSIWDNIGFADVYYQTRGVGGALDSLVPNGRPIPGAYNVHLDTELPTVGFMDSNPYSLTDSDHSYAWNGFYLASILDGLSEDINNNNVLDAGEDVDLDGEISTIHAPDTPVNYDQTGYAFSRLMAKAQRPTGADAHNFYGADQDHTYSDRTIVNEDGTPNIAGLSSLGLTQEQISTSSWLPQWETNSIVNGDFENPGSYVLNDKLPGWIHHGGGGNAEIGENAGNHYLKLNSGDDTRTHNAFYISPYMTDLSFELMVNGVSSDDILRVSLDGGIALGEFNLDVLDSSFNTKQLAIAPELRDDLHPYF